MAGEHDRESKTEEPTEKRITDAVDKGNVPLSREATLLGSLAGTLCVLLLMGGWFTAKIAETLEVALSGAGTLHIDDREAAAIYLISLLRDVGVPVICAMTVIACGSILMSLIQNVPTAAGERIRPQTSRISPIAGWNRLFGPAGLIEFAKAALKLVAAIVILWALFKRDLPQFAASLTSEPGLLPPELLELARGVLTPLAFFALLLALADLVWSRIRWRRELRMTRQEIKEEMKEAEGDPFIKARIRSISRQRASRRMMEALPKASMVITNPTHYAVALRYARGSDGAPVVVAKGVDHLALRIREIASSHEIPLIENRPLARGLYEQVDIDSQIPPEFYRAVAEIIHYLNRTGRLPRHVQPH